MAQQSPIWPPEWIPFIPPNNSGIGHDPQKLLDDTVFNFVEVDGYREHFADGDDQATRVFDVSWRDRTEWIAHMRGYSDNAQFIDISLFPTIVVGDPQLLRTIPAQHPERPWMYVDRVELMSISGVPLKNPALFAVDNKGDFILPGPNDPLPIRQLGPFGQPVFLDMLAAFDASSGRNGLARYAVTYRPRDYEIRNDQDVAENFGGNELSRYVRREFTYAASNLPYPAGSLAFADVIANPFKKQLIPVEGLFQIIGLVNMTYTWLDVPDIPEGAIQNCVGKINSLPFDGFSGAPEFPARTVVCHAPKKKRGRGINGRVTWEIQYFFTFREIPWDYLPARDGQFYQAVQTNPGFAAGGGPNLSNRPIIPEADFNALFHVGAVRRYQ